MKKLISVIGLAVILAACANPIYRPVLNQGTAFTQSSLNQLKVGQTMEQVLYILGSPNVVNSRGAVWLYVHRVVDSHGRVNQEIYQLIFTQDKLASFVKI